MLEGVLLCVRALWERTVLLLVHVRVLRDRPEGRREAILCRVLRVPRVSFVVQPLDRSFADFEKVSSQWGGCMHVGSAEDARRLHLRRSHRPRGVPAEMRTMELCPKYSFEWELAQRTQHAHIERGGDVRRHGRRHRRESLRHELAKEKRKEKTCFAPMIPQVLNGVDD